MANLWSFRQYDKLSKDHVPPQCFAPNPLTSFTQTSTSRFQYAWACKECNEYYGRYEKTFKNTMLMGSNGQTQAAADAWNNLISENRKSLERYRTPSKEFQNILDSFPEREIYSSGGIYLGKWRVMQIAQDSALKEEFIKIARGLHFIHTNAIIPNSYEMGVVLNDRAIFFEELLKAPFFRFDTDFFEYFGAAPKEDLSIGLWYMRFYKGYTAQVWFRPKRV